MTNKKTSMNNKSDMPAILCKILIALSACLLFFQETGLGQVATLQPTLQLKQIDGYWLPFQNNLPLPSFDRQPRPTIDIGGVWRKERFSAGHSLTLFRRDQAGIAAIYSEARGRNDINYDDSAWEEMILPMIENELSGYEAAPEYYEDGVWYRRSFVVPDSLQ
ncbi:hypothetical protein JXO59_12310, partial [candidate division KSB1 bacterium]|nr:hypothetical protein [candidate division KSB1 bacterium]